MYTIENEHLSVTINAKGAELAGIFSKDDKLEYLWNGDPAFWAKRSPVLFPVVGTLKDNGYFFEGRQYELSRHGFARDKIFEVSAQTRSSIMFTLHNDDETLKVYPFYFSFSITYTLQQNCLSVTYNVKNNGTGKMYFSVGGHPAFKLPLTGDLEYSDYYLLFDKVENAGRWPISKEGLIEKQSLPLLDNTDVLSLSKELFYQDAIVFKELHSTEIDLKTDKHSAGFKFSFKGFPFLGIWAAKDADFVCIEPWCGIADSVDTLQDIKDKEGIIPLDAGDNFDRTWSITLY